MSGQDTEFTLSFGDQSAVVSPYGASLRRYSLKRWNAVWAYQGGANKQGGQGDVLIRWPGRIKDGVYSFEGKTHQLVKNDKDGPNAIHGFLRSQLFEVVKTTETEAVFKTEFSEKPGYPFSLSIEVAYTLDADGLATRFQVTNTGRGSAPVAAGFHPYFCGDIGELADLKVTIPAQKYIELETMIPTGRVPSVEGTSLDFRTGRFVGETKYNDCVVELDRDAKKWATAWVSARGSDHKISIRMDENFDYVVIYTGDQIPSPHARRAFAIEPMTCAPDAFNHDGWGTRKLKAGESCGGTYVIKAE